LAENIPLHGLYVPGDISITGQVMFSMHPVVYYPIPFNGLEIMK
jgi:hypothetical protein